MRKWYLLFLFLFLLIGCEDIVFLNANANFIHNDRFDGNGFGEMNRTASNTSNNIPYINSQNLTFNYHNRTR